MELVDNRVRYSKHKPSGGVPVIDSIGKKEDRYVIMGHIDGMGENGSERKQDESK